MSDHWEHHCTSVDSIDTERIDQHMTRAEQGGWELVNACMLVAPSMGGRIEQCTMFWKRPAAVDDHEVFSTDLDLSTMRPSDADQ